MLSNTIINECLKILDIILEDNPNRKIDDINNFIFLLIKIEEYYFHEFSMSQKINIDEKMDIVILISECILERLYILKIININKYILLLDDLNNKELFESLVSISLDTHHSNVRNLKINFS